MVELCAEEAMIKSQVLVEEKNMDEPGPMNSNSHYSAIRPNGAGPWAPVEDQLYLAVDRFSMRKTSCSNHLRSFFFFLNFFFFPFIK